MSRVSPTKRIERSGVNALRTLLEEHDHLVHEIDGGADLGEDLFLIFVRRGRRTGHVVAVQVKAGSKYKRAAGYAIPVGDHRDDWVESRIPVVGVVYDRATKRLYWANLSERLKQDPDQPWVQISREAELNDETLPIFMTEMQRYIDTSGMRVRTDDAHLVERVRAARAGIPLDPMKDSDAPNPMFEGLASLFVTHPHLVRNLRTLVYVLLVACVMIFEWPFQNKFAAQYLPSVPSWTWVTGMYSMILVLLMVIRSERKSNRRALGAMKWVFYISWYYAFLPFQMGDGQGFDATWGKLYAYPMLILPGIVVPGVVGHYLMVEVQRLRDHAHG